MECVSHEAERPRSRYDVEVLQSNVPLALQSHACYNFEPLLLPKMSKFKAFMHLATLFFYVLWHEEKSGKSTLWWTLISSQCKKHDQRQSHKREIRGTQNVPFSPPVERNKL